MGRSKSQPAPQSPSDKASVRKPTRLGRGLSALMAQTVQVSPVRHPVVADASEGRPSTEAQGAPGATDLSGPQAESGQVDSRSDVEGLLHLPVSAISANPHQPRQAFNQEALGRLADSIRADGLMQPIIVRPSSQQAPDGGVGVSASIGRRYELVAGERRWRAAQLAGLDVVPAIVRALDDQQLAEWALIENLQREDLNPIERAEAFQHLIDRFHLSHDQIAQRVGVERPTISNALRLLNLSEQVQQLVRDGLLSSGQAKAVAGISDPAQQWTVAQRVVARGWSVRQVEQEIRRLAVSSPSAADAPVRVHAPTAYVRDLEKQLGQELGTKVRIKPGRKKGSGTLLIEFYSLDEFDALMQRLQLSVQAD